MYTPITQSLQKNNRFVKLLLCCCFALLSVFPIYRNFYYSNGLLTYERHKAVIENRSEYYNPWQYRILCPYMIEGGLWIYNHTIDKIYPIEEKLNFSIENTSGTTAETDQFIKLMRTPGAVKYLILFVLFRFLEHMTIFFLSWKLWSYFVKSKWLLFLGINFLTLALGNAVSVADLSFNTYMDIILYLLTANIIIYKKNYMWILPISIIAAFNRETGIMIPALYFISQTDFTGLKFKNFHLTDIKLPSKTTWIITLLSYVFFISIFTAIRIHYGYRPQQVWKAAAGLPMLKLNLMSAVGFKAFMELIGTFGVLPLLLIYKFKSFPNLLKKWFLFLVPIWFAIHFVSVVAYQTRLFMVPFIVIMFPMILWLIEQEIIAQKNTLKNEF